MRWQVGVELFAARRVSGAPVVDDSGVVIGVVSESDLLPKIAARSGQRGRRPPFRWRRPAAPAKSGGLIARDLMTTPAVTVSPSVGHVCGRTAAEAVWCPLSVEE